MTYRGHIEATFESAHKADVPGHKCSGTMRGVPQDIIQVLKEFFGREGEGPIETHALLELLNDKFDYHGHSWLAEIDFEFENVDDHFWGPDFGKVKDLIRELDHHNLNLMFEQPTSEMITKWLFDRFYQVFGFPPLFVKLHEGRGNTMTYSG